MNILLIDDKRAFFDILKDNFSYTGHHLMYSKNTAEALGIIQKHLVEIILLDINLGTENGIDTLQTIKNEFPHIPIIMITGFASVETAVNSMKLGAYDYVKKPLDFSMLNQLVERAYEANKYKLENKNLKNRLIEKIPITDSLNPQVKETLERAKKLADTELPILILGDNGTGKELLADYIHSHSQRNSEKMLKINCAAFPENLLDNELFGHEKGAYTGADSRFKGIFERADQGTLFLDEIGDMPLSIQSKILRVLQNQEIRRIGGEKNIKIDVRFIAATNKNPEKLIEEGLFRRDLYYRLNTALLHLQPLRNRLEDLPILIRNFINQQEEGKSISEQVMELFRNYSWPGNIRELKNVINYAAIISNNETIKLSDLPPSFSSSSTNNNKLSPIQENEKELIEKTLRKYNYNKTKSAKALHMSRNTLYLKINRFGIEI